MFKCVSIQSPQWYPTTLKHVNSSEYSTQTLGLGRGKLEFVRLQMKKIDQWEGKLFARSYPCVFVGVTEYPTPGTEGGKGLF